jgi:DNA-binding response OmpR family regulator
MDAGPSSEPAVAVSPETAANPRVLVAEDSITARIFLRRLLEQMGFEVEAVTSLRELRAVIGHGPWAIVMVDVDLPDARGARVLAGLAPRSERGPSPVVALVRDDEDTAVARSAGVRNTLRKPFERDDLERLLIALDREPRGG